MAADILTQNDQQVIHDYREFLRSFSPRKKRALLSYLTLPVMEELNSKKIVRFSNSGIALSWVRVLNELGYTVDIINWDDKEYVPQREYDLVVFHGGKNFNNVYPALKGKPKIIHFLTGSYWRFNNSAEDARIKDFERRHKIKVERDRYIHAPEDPVNEVADGIIVLGDPSMRNTYPEKYSLVLTINNGSCPDKHFRKIKKNYAGSKHNFLFFAGSGNIHKGLDLLIDSFKDLDEHLYIVTVLDKKVLAVFKQELKLPNIHLIGQVEMRSAQFYELMDKCAYAILPSCSEGQAGSVVEAMNQGLIPIVSKETRLDTGSFGVTLKNNSIKCIKETVHHMAMLETTNVKKLSRLTRQAVKKDHSPKKFRKDLKKAVEQVLDAQNAQF